MDSNTVIGVREWLPLDLVCNNFLSQEVAFSSDIMSCVKLTNNDVVHLGITVFKIFIWGDISLDIWWEIKFYRDTRAESLNVISDRISDNIPPQLKILNMVFPILMHFCKFISNWSVANRIKLHVTNDM